AGATLADAPASVTAVANAVAERAGGASAAFPAMPMAVGVGRGGGEGGAKFDARYHPASAAAVLRPILELRGVRVDEAESARKRALALEAAGEYVRAYAAYWSAGVIEQSLPAADTAWAEVHAAASGAPDAWMHHTPLRALVQASRQSARSLSEGLKGLMDAESVRELDRLERASDRALATLDDAGFERAAQSRLGAWRGLGAEASSAVGAIRRALSEPARASEWFVTVLGRAGDADLAQAYWRGLCLRAAETLRRSADAGASAGLALLGELAFPLAAEGAGRTGSLTQEEVAVLVPRLRAAQGAGEQGAGEAGAGGRSFSPDAEIESHASALADGTALSVSERLRLGEALAIGEWIAAQGGREGGVAYSARAAAPMEASVVSEGGVVRVVVKDGSGGMVADRAFGGSGVWPALRMLARAVEVDASRGPGTWVATVELTSGDGNAARVAVEIVFGGGAGGPPALPFRRAVGR
ncbi:MAG: hypothetical protein KF768_12435, partial [Phycisphaeraceae bacterium]|nr:hypothetical protein [Phycisphaeraceae bacterium]